MAPAGCARCAGPTNGTTSSPEPEPTARSASSTVSRSSPIARRSCCPIASRPSSQRPPARTTRTPINTLPLEYINETLQFHPEWVVDKIAPRPILFITTDDDRLVPPEESQALFDKAGEPKSLIVLRGFGHYEVYTEPAFSQVMAPTVAWFERFMPARSDDGGTALSA